MPSDTYVITALALYLVVAACLAGFLTWRFISGRRALWGRLRKGLEHASSQTRVAFGLLPGRKGDDFLVYGEGRKIGQIGAEEGAFDRPFEFRDVDRFALVKDMDGQTGLVLVAGDETYCVTGLEAMARIYHLVQQDEVEVELVFRDDENDRINGLYQQLDAKERELLAGWLTEEEVVTDIILGVDYEGQLQTSGTKGAANLIVTNLRVGLLARTIETQTSGNTTTTTTHYNLISYLLPLAEKVTIERTPDVGTTRYLVHLELPEDQANATAPVLKLTNDHAGIFLPLVLFSRPVVFKDQPVTMGGLVKSVLLAGFGWGILFGLLALGGAMIPYLQGSAWWYERYLVPAAIGGFLSPFIFRGRSIVENFFDRALCQGATAMSATG